MAADTVDGMVVAGTDGDTVSAVATAAVTGASRPVAICGLFELQQRSLRGRAAPCQPGLRAKVGTPAKCGAHFGALATKMLAVG